MSRLPPAAGGRPYNDAADRSVYIKCGNSNSIPVEVRVQ